MTEAEWLKEPGLNIMTGYLRKKNERRRLRLFACACCRRMWHLLRLNAAKTIVAVSEAFADGEVTEAELRALHSHPDFDCLTAQERGEAEEGSQLTRRTLDAIGAARFLAAEYFEQTDGPFIVAQDTSLDAAHDFVFKVNVHMLSAGVPPDTVEYAEKERLLRDIFGNPFRPVAFDAAWRTSTVVALARGMYESRDFCAMPILADALQDAGCDSDDILAHCRGLGPHVRGCWVVDLVLGKAYLVSGYRSGPGEASL